MADIVDFVKRSTNDNTSKEVPKENLYTYKVVHRRLLGEASNSSLEYIETKVKGSAAGIGPNYIAVSHGKGDDAGVVFICTLDMLDSITRVDAEEPIKDSANKTARKKSTSMSIDPSYD